MKSYYLENNFQKIEITSKGAELQSIYNKETQLEYLWNGDANFWGKKSPVLFPIVGGLKNNEYLLNGNNYILGRHGFARDTNFEVEQKSSSEITCLLKSNESTLINFPFQFIFTIEYIIIENKLSCKYIVINCSKENMYFSLGAHPAFNVPLTQNTNYNDWFLEFNSNENCGIYPLTIDGLLKEKSQPFFKNSNKINLSKELFYNDALVFKELQSTEICIKSNSAPNGLKMQFDGFPFYGIWSAKDANFVCLEPWCGIADNENTTNNFKTKEGIIELEHQQIFERTWSIETY